MNDKGDQTASLSGGRIMTREIAFLGPEATFSHEAAISHFGETVSFHGADDIEEIFDLVAKDTCYEGIVPIENSYEGSVTRTLDMFYKYDLKIVAEIFVRIRHQLLSMAKYMEEINRIYSHPMAIAQCRLWLKRNMPGISIREVGSTSRAASIVTKEPDAAAVASRFSGEIYSLNILKENIEDDPDNVTRFLAIGKNRPDPTGRDKTSIMFSLGHKPGALYNALGALADEGVNMTRIESRPIKIKSWEYLFFVDLEGHEDDKNLGIAMKKMEERCVFMKRLGSYPAGHNAQRA